MQGKCSADVARETMKHGLYTPTPTPPTPPPPLGLDGCCAMFISTYPRIFFAGNWNVFGLPFMFSGMLLQTAYWSGVTYHSCVTGNINQSLLTLGRVITALVEHAPHIPYRLVFYCLMLGSAFANDCSHFEKGI